MNERVTHMDGSAVTSLLDYYDALLRQIWARILGQAPPPGGWALNLDAMDRATLLHVYAETVRERSKGLRFREGRYPRRRGDELLIIVEQLEGLRDGLEPPPDGWWPFLTTLKADAYEPAAAYYGALALGDRLRAALCDAIARGDQPEAERLESEVQRAARDVLALRPGKDKRNA